MNYIIAIIQPSQLEAVQEKLTAAGVSGMTVTEVRGYGRQRGKTEIYRGTEYSINFLPKIKLELALDDKASAEAVDIITEVCKSGVLAMARSSRSHSPRRFVFGPVKRVRKHFSITITTSKRR